MIVPTILLPLALAAQRLRRLQVVPVPLEDALEVRDELLLEARRHPVDAVHRPLLDLRDVETLSREVLPDRVLIAVDQLAREGLSVQGVHFFFFVHALRKPGLDALDQWPAGALGLLGQDGLQRVVQDDDVLELEPDGHAIHFRRGGKSLLVQRLFRLFDQADSFVEIGLLPGRRVVAEEAADEINLLVRVPHLDCNGGTQSVAVWAALAPFRLAKGNPIRREGIGQGFGILPEHEIVIVGILEGRKLRNGHQAVDPTKARAGVTALVSEIPGASPEPARQRNLRAVAAIQPRRGLLGHRVQELVEVERIDAAVWCKDRTGSGRDFIPDDLRAHFSSLSSPAPWSGTRAPPPASSDRTGRRSSRPARRESARRA